MVFLTWAIANQHFNAPYSAETTTWNGFKKANSNRNLEAALGTIGQPSI